MSKYKDVCSKRAGALCFCVGLALGAFGLQVTEVGRPIIDKLSNRVSTVISCEESVPVSKVISLNNIKSDSLAQSEATGVVNKASKEFDQFEKYGLTPVYATSFQRYIISELSKGHTTIDLVGRYKGWDPYKMFAEINDVTKLNPWFGYIRTCEFNPSNRSVKIILRNSRVSYEEMLDQASQKADSVIKSVITDDMSDREKVIALADYISRNAKYDDRAATSVTASSGEEIPSQYLPSFNAYGALVEGKCCCVGYANALQMFLNKLGIKSIIEWGYLNGLGEHMWTTINLDGTWYSFDMTGYTPSKKGSALVYDKTVNKSTHLLYNLSDYKVSL